MPSLTRNKSVVAGGVSLNGAITVTDTELIITGPTAVPAAQPSSLTTRTNNTTGTLTMTNANTHGVITGQRIDLYWNGGQIYNVTVGTVSGASVPITTLNTANLPTVNTAVSVGIATRVACNIIGNNLTALATALPPFTGAIVSKGYFVFGESGGTDDLEVVLLAGDCYSWETGTQNSNPLATYTTAWVYCSHSGPAALAMPITVLTH